MGIRVRVERRLTVSPLVTAVSLIVSLLIALLVIAGTFLLAGVDPVVAYTRMFRGAFGSTYGLMETLVKTIPLLITAVGLSVAFRAVIWNIGAEGQLLMGAVAATWVALFLMPGAPAWLMIPSMFIAGFIAGALWALIPAFLRAKYQTNEVITTLMTVYIASEFVNYLVYGPWKGAKEWGFPYSDKFPQAAQLPVIGVTRVHYPTLVLGLVLVVLIYIFLMHTKWGYEVRVVGENPTAARYAGIDDIKVILLVMIISGGLAGLAGVGEVAGVHHRLRVASGISAGYGFTAIIVAWLGRLNPFAILVASFLFGGLLVGGDALQVALQLPVPTIQLFNGVILFFVLAAEVLSRYTVRVERVGARHRAPVEVGTPGSE